MTDFIPPEIKTITYGKVNCYLINTGSCFVLVDTGFPTERSKLEDELAKSGCEPGNLQLIVLTHGDFDHTGNAAYLREKYGAPIAMHPSEFEVVGKGEILASRQRHGLPMRIFSRLIIKVLLPLMGMGKFIRFKPDLEVTEGFDLSSFGFDARVLHIPGHSRGSIGVMTVNGDLFSGDLLARGKKNGLNSLIDNLAEAQASLARLKNLNIIMVYPGHGRPFLWKDF
jgi:hydroxyacylglutathione hydrolase